MFWKLLIIILITSLAVPFVSADPFTDLWDWLFGDDEINIIESSSTILSKNTERICNSEVCNMLIGSDMFFEYNNNFYTFNEFLIDTRIIDSSIIFTYMDGTIINVTPLIDYNRQEVYLNDFVSINPINYESIIIRSKNNVKFSTNLTKIDGLSKIGFQITHNQRDESYKDINDLEITNKIIGNIEMSYYDMVDNSFDVSFEKEKDIVWIDVSQLSGELNLDPMFWRYGSDSDGHIILDPYSGGTVCSGYDNSSQTNTIADNILINYQHWSFLKFYTGGIPDDATITSASVTVYASQFGKRCDPVLGCPNNLWDVGYKTRGVNLIGLNCSDKELPNYYEGTLNWSESVGFKTKTLNNFSQINVTGFYVIRMTPTWSMVGGGDSSTATWRSGDYVNNDFSPVLNVTYTTVVDTDSPYIIWISPTPDDGSTQVENAVYLNTTIVDDFNTSSFFDWNGSLKMYLSMDYANTTGVFDNSTYDNFGVFGGGLVETDIETGKYGNCTLFDGTGDYINMSDDDDILNLTTGTLEVWVKTDLSQWNTVFGIAPEFDNNDGWEFALRTAVTTGNIFIFQRNQNTTIMNLSMRSSSHNITANTWNHLVWMVNDTGNVFYLNREKVDFEYFTGSSSTSQFFGDMNVSDKEYMVGSRKRKLVYQQFFKGYIDELRIHNRTLSEVEINASYDSGTYKLYNNFTGLNNGTYDYSAYSIDTSGNLNISTRTVTIGDVGVCTNSYSSGDFIVANNEEVNCTNENFTIDGALQVNGVIGLLNLWEWTNITLNQTAYNYVNSSGGKIIYYNDSKLI